MTLVVLLCGIFLFSTEVKANPCPRGGSYFNGFCYSVLGFSGHYAHAFKTCFTNGQTMVSINSASEETFVENLVHGAPFWLGIRRHYGIWKWLDTNMPYQFSRFIQGHPNPGLACAQGNRPSRGMWMSTTCGDYSVQTVVCKGHASYIPSRPAPPVIIQRPQPRPVIIQRPPRPIYIQQQPQSPQIIYAGNNGYGTNPIILGGGGGGRLYLGHGTNGHILLNNPNAHLLLAGIGGRSHVITHHHYHHFQPQRVVTHAPVYVSPQVYTVPCSGYGCSSQINRVKYIDIVGHY